MGRSKRTKVFISYSHKDAAALERLQVHLRPLERQGIVDRWDDTKIQAGQDWKAEIERALSEARVAILLISADFLASDFIDEDELPPILLAQKEEGLEVLQVILGACLFELTPTLNRFQAINSPSEPLLGLPSVEQDRVWVRLVTRVVEILKDTSELALPGESSVVELRKTEVLSDSVSPAVNPVQAELVKSEPLQDFSVDLGDGVQLELVSIPDGIFFMGSPRNEEGVAHSEDETTTLEKSPMNTSIDDNHFGAPSRISALSDRSHFIPNLCNAMKRVEKRTRGHNIRSRFLTFGWGNIQ